MKKIVIILSFLLSISISYAGDLNELSDELTYLECELAPLWRPSKQNPAESLEHSHSHPLIPATRGTSSTNWSGYAAATNLNNPSKNSVSEVSGSWIVPTISPSSNQTYSSIWVGIDGYASSTVEQIGTEHDWDGEQVHYAWFEMYPQGSYELVGFPVHPGDSISASVTYKGNGVFLLTITNNTKRVTTKVPTSKTTSKSAQRSSAEWIVEAPSENSVLPLAHFSTINWSHCTTTINNIHSPINGQGHVNTSLTMVTNSNQTKASPSTLSSNGQQFSMTWHHQ